MLQKKILKQFHIFSYSLSNRNVTLRAICEIFIKTAEGSITYHILKFKPVFWTVPVTYFAADHLK